jgi:hypothetical protein
LKDYAKYSFWLETAADSLAPRPTLSASTIVDVAILGGGYSGLWTAYALRGIQFTHNWGGPWVYHATGCPLSSLIQLRAWG